MLIVCSEYSLQIKPESSSPEDEVVLFLDRITNFPGYTTGTEEDTGANLKGPSSLIISGYPLGGK